MQITMAMPLLNRTQELYFAGLIFVACQSTAKTAKIGPRENFPLYGGNICNCFVLCILQCHFFPSALPPTPQNPSYTIQQHGRDNVTVTVQWQYDDGNSVSYIITVSPDVGTFTTSRTNVTVNVPYNVIHTVSIVATNSNGSSSATMLTIPAISKYCHEDHQIGMLSSLVLWHDYHISSNSVVHMFVIQFYGRILCICIQRNVRSVFGR